MTRIFCRFSVLKYKECLSTIRYFNGERARIWKKSGSRLGQAQAVVLCSWVRHQAPVVRKMDNAIHRINLYPLGSTICFVNTYPLHSDLSAG